MGKKAKRLKRNVIGLIHEMDMTMNNLADALQPIHEALHGTEAWPDQVQLKDLSVSLTVGELRRIRDVFNQEIGSYELDEEIREAIYNWNRAYKNRESDVFAFRNAEIALNALMETGK